jgi:cell filamentation protein
MKYTSSDDEAEVLPNLLGSSSLVEVQDAETEGFLVAEQQLLDELREQEIFTAAYIRAIH